MKKIFLILFLITTGFLSGLYFYSLKKEESTIKEKKLKISPIPTPSKFLKKDINRFSLKEEKSIFIPQWQLNQLEKEKIDFNLLNNYQRLIYFGDDRELKRFLNLINQEEKNWFLWTTYKISDLPPKDQWKEIVEGKKGLLKEFSLEGIVLDLEISGLPTENLILNINQFSQFFLSEIKKENFKTAIAIYGDVFFRKRPYDLAYLEKLSDEIMIMAYDFSKSYGEPGPNFPFEGREKFAYDFKTMIDDFLSVVPANKLTVIFGMYGYDWLVDEKKRPISQAKALTLNQIKKKFFGVTSLHRSDKDVTFKEEFECLLENCLIKRHSQAQEIEINYFISSKTPDEGGVYRLNYHVVWFEDKKSAESKKDYLREKGIGDIAYWAYGYF